MSAIKRLLKRWGYARLEDFGLLLTPDGRVLATRPAVLDDGLGGCVVGWRNGDLAALELEPWTPLASQRTSRPQVTAKQRPASIASKMREPGAPVQSAIPDHAVVAPPIEAEPAAEAADEDEWEWEIVMARARVAAEPTEEPAAPPTVAAGSSRWLARAALTELDDDTAITPAAKLAQYGEPDLATAPLRPSQLRVNPKTVIPVPRLPAAADPAAMMRSMAPVRTLRSAGQSAPATRPFRRIATRR